MAGALQSGCLAAGMNGGAVGGKGKRKGGAIAAKMDPGEVGRRRERWERQTQQPHVQNVRASTAILPITAHRHAPQPHCLAHSSMASGSPCEFWQGDPERMLPITAHRHVLGSDSISGRI